MRHGLAAAERMSETVAKLGQSRAIFRRRSCDVVKQLKRIKHLAGLTTNRKAAVMQNPDASQRVLDLAAHADPEEGIRQGLDDAKNRKIRPAEEFFAEFEARRGLSG